MAKVFGDYYLGLDIGTESVGWAVTDTKYNVNKLNGKAMWGVRLFDEAQTAENRRLKRGTRRRNDRKKQRIRLLQEIFAQEISKVDQGFFHRMKESRYYREDKRDIYGSKTDDFNALFSDEIFKDKDYHKKFPTIYHLREYLIDSNEKPDIRFVYLALHHIIKKRGHFLFEGQNIDSEGNFENIFNEFCCYLKEEYNIEYNNANHEAIKKILKNKEIGKKEKSKRLIKELGSTTKQEKEIIKLLTGSKVTIKTLFNLEEDYEDIKKISFDDSKYEEIYEKLQVHVQNKIEIIDSVKALYDWAILERIIKGKAYLSSAKTSIYNKHKNDLRILKKYIKKYKSTEDYKKIFKDPEVKDGYCKYVGVCSRNGKKAVLTEKCSQSDLCKKLRGIFKDVVDESDEFNKMKSELEYETFLPKIVTGENSVIPYQLNLKELNAILKNASKYYSFIDEKDEVGYSNREKIQKIFEFKIPYYVGPLNDYHKQQDGIKGNCWIVKRNNQNIRPWNFEEVVDKEACAEKFILRMTNKCTYLVGEDVLPKDSLLYSEFMVLNELNNLRIEGQRINQEIKNLILEKLFYKKNKVTIKDVKKLLYSEGYIQAIDIEIAGIDKDFKSTLTSYLEFNKILGNDFDRNMVETIIKWIVLFGEDKKLLRNRIKNHYSEVLDETQINKIMSKAQKYKGWGRLSSTLLNNDKEKIFHINRETGEKLSIIKAMRNNVVNLMELLSREYDFLDNIDEFNHFDEKPEEITYDLVEELYVSPAVKRSIWQSLMIVKEIKKVTKKEPKKIFIELAREKGEKKRTKSRKDKLIELYKNCKQEERKWVEELEGKEESKFRSKRLYLYYTQMGRCMYSNEKISLDKLFDSELYDIDHIYPQSKVKDDSIDNTVLVLRKYNEQKTDRYPIDREWQRKQKEFWNMLMSKDLISKEKYNRLIRNTDFTENELSNFIARQLVETRQSTKAVASILKTVFTDASIVYVKASNISRFRNENGFVKVREINDFHHGKDAYLSIVVGNVYDTKFTRNPMNFIKKGYKYNLNKMYEQDVVRDNVVAWRCGVDGTIKNVRKIMNKNNLLVTRMSVVKKGQISKVTPMKKGNGQLAIKESDDRLRDINKYGGYDSPSIAYFFVVEHSLVKKKKEERIRTIENVPIYLVGAIKNKNDLKKYCECELKYVNPTIIIDMIKTRTLIKIDGFKMNLNGKSNNKILISNANQLIIDNKRTEYIKDILKFLKRNVEASDKLEICSHDNITEEGNLDLYVYFINKIKDTIYNIKLSKFALDLEDGTSKFKELTLKKQCEVLKEVLKFFRCTSENSKIVLVGGASNAGKLSINKNISSLKDIRIINQSITGLFEREVDLLKK